MRPLTESEKIQKFCYIVPPVTLLTLSFLTVAFNEPDVGVPALFSKASPNRCTLLLDHGTLVCDSLGGAHITDKLLHYVSLLACSLNLRGEGGGEGGIREYKSSF